MQRMRGGMGEASIFFIPLVINSMNVAAINIRLAIFYSESKALKFILKP